ncbi:MAG: tyrosine-type recombinase/integrase [Candidatus Eisenbacteria sp.]|nr:tyrosine-type recombinase/integrase [Candidatus Eisenbacteria bacterium]
MRISAVVSLYVSHKRALGYRFRTEDGILRAFCKAVDDKPIVTIEAQTVLAFLNGSGPVTEYWAKKYHVLSGLYRFALARGLADLAPLPPTVPKSTVPAFVPYVYSHEELQRLLDAVPAACGGRVPIEENVFRTLLLLLYGAGLRGGEALALTLGDVDLHEACLQICETKFFKSRLVPMGTDLTGVLTEYLARRNECYDSADQAPLFCFRDGSPLSSSAARNAFRRLRAHAGLQREGGAGRQPRLHDLRHAAAVHRLIAWYSSGADVQKLLPKLAIYLGHVNLSSTQRYLTLSPELLRQASQRFEHYAMERNHD